MAASRRRDVLRSPAHPLLSANATTTPKYLLFLEKLALSALILCFTPACRPDLPTEDDARSALKLRVDGGDERRVTLTGFTKTDGREKEVSGLRLYDLFFDSIVEFVDDAGYIAGRPGDPSADSIATREFVASSGSFSWSDYFDRIGGVRNARIGDRLQLRGVASFERRESGWIVTAVRFTSTHDSSTRDMQAMERRERALAAAESALARAREDSAVETRRRQEMADSLAERLTFTIAGRAQCRAYPQECANIYESGAYFIGRLSGNDALHLKRVAGKIDGVGVMLATTCRAEVRRPGAHIAGGECGGGGRGHQLEDELRVSFESQIGAVPRDVYVTVAGPGDFEIRATVICPRVPESTGCGKP